jgi:hypothetical protein
METLLTDIDKRSQRLEMTKKHLDTYADVGLRTLMLAQREI